ncbi:MAG: PorT family protein [Bacteroidales bacterium]|nr:PorT family protein [Bacteroidales bacterium]
MHYKSIIIAILVFCSFPIQDCYSATSAGSTASFVGGSFTAGLYTGYTYNHLHSLTGYRSFTEYRDGHGYVIGIPVGYLVTEWFTVQVEPSIIAKSYSLVRTDYAEGNEQNWRNTYLQLPLIAQFSFGGKKLRGFVNLGGYVGGWINSHTWGKYSETTSYLEDNKEYFYYFKENIKFNKERDNRFDGGLLIGLGLKYDFTHWGLFAEARYYYSLSDMQKNYMYGQVPRYNDTYVFTVGATYKIGNR